MFSSPEAKSNSTSIWAYHEPRFDECARPLLLARGLLSLLAFGLVGCSGTTDLPSSASANRNSSLPIAGLHGIDAQFARIADTIPGFGGWYFDSTGILQVYVHDSSQAGAAALVARDFFSNRGAYTRPGYRDQIAINVRIGVYDFRELAAWRSQIDPLMASVPGIVFTDIDEAHNRILIGVVDRMSADAVNQRIAELGIPPRAISTEITSPATPVLTLQDTKRPIPAGFQINFYQLGVPKNCTLGVNVLRVQYHFLVASHCTPSMGAVQGTVYSQPTAPGHRVGVEVTDPPFFTNTSDATCPAGRRCRYADAALVKYDDSVSVRFGYIARPVDSNYVSGPITIDDQNPEFRIVSQTAFPSVGEVLHKIGRTTGWTFGSVDLTCATVNYVGDPGDPTDITWLCQDRSYGGVGAGDSGAPVFGHRVGGDVSYMGLVWGDAGGARMWLSSSSNIREDLGTIVIY